MLTKEEIRQINDNLHAPVLSLVLHVDPGYRQNQSDTPAWRIWLKSTLREIEKEADARGEDTAAAWSGLRKRLENWLATYTPQGKTLIVFVDGDSLFTYELPVTLENHATLGEADLTPVLWAIDEYERYLIALVDQEEAKFLSAYLGNTSTESTMSIDLDLDWGEKTLMPVTAQGESAIREGSNRERFEDMIEAHVDRFHQDVADHIHVLLGEMEASRLIIGGAGRAAHNVRGKLHETVVDRLVDVLPIPIDASETRIRDSVLEAGLQHERQHEEKLLAEVIGYAKADGRGALGVEAVDRAFTMQQVELLLLPYPPEDPKSAAALTNRALQSNSEVELIHGEPAERLREEGGVAARLYYAINEV